jgi:ArsR family transcriptional regulator
LRRSVKKAVSALDSSDEVFASAAELFKVMSASMRLKILACLCDGERNVSYLLSKIDTTQPNMSQHLRTLYRAKILGKRRDRNQIFYHVIDQCVLDICRAVCAQVESTDPRL